MMTSDLIRKLCEEKGISIAELARRIGQTPQNFGKKLKRNTVSQDELHQIAEVLGVTYEQAFVPSDNTGSEIISADNEDVLVNRFFSEELGLTIQPFDSDQAMIDNDYVKLDDEAFARINSLFQSLPHYAAEIKAKRLSVDTYKVIYDKGLGQLQQSAKNRDRFRANVVEFGTNNSVTSQAELEKFQLKITSPALALFDVAAIVTNQYFLARIDSQLVALSGKLDYIQKFLEESKKSDLWANGQFLKDVSGKVYAITSDEQYRLATLTTVQGIRRDALSNVKFYHKMMSDYVETHFDKNIKAFSETKGVLDTFYDLFDAYCYSVFVYGVSYVIEVALTQITDEAFLCGVRDEIEGVIDGFKNDYTRELQQFIDTAKSLNPGFLTEVLSNTSGVHYFGSSWAGLLLQAVELTAELVATHDKKKKKTQKEEIEKQFKVLQGRTENSIAELNKPILALDQMNELFNRPVEMLFTEDGAYIKLTADTSADETDAPVISEEEGKESGQ